MSFPEKHRVSWTQEDDSVLVAEYDATNSDELGVRLGRTPKAIRERVRQLKILGAWNEHAVRFAEAADFVDVETLLYLVRHAPASELVVTIGGLGNLRKR